MNHSPSSKFRVVLATSVVFLLAITLWPSPPASAFGANKDMVQLQTEVAQLQQAISQLQQSTDKNMGMLQNLIQQTADSVNTMSGTVGTLQKNLQAIQSAQGTKSDQLSGQIDALNTSVDELKAHISRLEKTAADIQSAQQTMGLAVQNLTPPAVTPAIDPATGQPIAPSAPGASPSAAGAVPTAPAGPDVRQIYAVGLADYNSNSTVTATQVFNQIIKTYPKRSPRRQRLLLSRRDGPQCRQIRLSREGIRCGP